MARTIGCARSCPKLHVLLLFLWPVAIHWQQPQWEEYLLLDSGDGWKAERFGDRVLLRPETSAVWPMERSLEFWQKHVDAWFEFNSKKSGFWNNSKGVTPNWNLHVPEACGGFRMGLELTAFKHVGIFPEQASNWAYIVEQLGRFEKGAKVLNLFAYTGGASLAAASMGADVTHVDSIKQVVSWTRENMERSKLEGIRWVVEDALKFMQREARRGNKYVGIIMDPPTWGLGAKGEKWRLEDQINTLFATASELLEEQHFGVISTYSGLTATMVEQLARVHFTSSDAEARELAIPIQNSGQLPLGNTLRLSR